MNSEALMAFVAGRWQASFQAFDAFGNVITPSAALADLGSFSWRGREGTINFRFVSTSGDPGLSRMGDRAMESATGRFTQADRLVLDGISPIAANRYAYATADPVNHTDPTGYVDFTVLGQTITHMIRAGVINTISYAGQAAPIISTPNPACEWFGFLCHAGER